MTRVAPVYQCLFFVDGRIEYWENIESYSDEVIEVLLDRKLSAENWEAAEAWSQDQLICRIVAPVGRRRRPQSTGDVVYDRLHFA
jgi:hypothetical protein